MSGGRIVGMLCLLAPLLSGCSAGNVTPKNDPLVGGGPAIPPAGAGAVTRGPDKPLPPLPAPNGATSPAALASGAVPKLDDSGRDMRIPSERDPAASWRGQAPAGLSLGRPEPVRDVGGDRGLTPVPVVGGLVPAGGMATAAGSIDQMMRFLEQRGMKGFRLEMLRETGQWRCSCSIPTRQNPTIKQTYDTTAADPQSALRAVVEQVERENR